MRRWNGWGETNVDFPLVPRARRFLEERLGPGARPRDASLGEVVRRVPPSRLPPHPLVTTESGERVRHALGQSLPDWIAARSGEIPAFPDGVAFPEATEEVRELVRFAAETGACLIPHGGGTSVAGQVSVTPSDRPAISVDMGRMSRLLALDEESGLATFGAGVKGPDVEARLRARGFTLGHYPQSFEYSTLGGWVATRSVGQQSLGYGRMERLFAGARVETPVGTLAIPPFPASAAGPDVREAVLGSEGRLGILTEVTVRVRRLPEVESFHGLFFPRFEQGLAAVRDIVQMVQAGPPLSMLRLSTAEETATNLILAGHERLLGLLERYLALRGAGEGKCMLIMGLTGRRAQVRAVRRQALAVARSHGGIDAGELFGREWMRHRFRAPYLRNSLWELGYAVDTLETAAPWRRVPSLVEAVEQALGRALDGEEAGRGERVFAFTHLSHPYADGSSVYTTCLYRLAPDPDESLRRWQRLKGAASHAIVEGGGTISHQHGVGTDHRPFLESEKGPLGMEYLRALFRTFDPQGIMNPGKLV